MVDGYRSVPRHEVAALVAEDFDRTPLTSQHEVRKSVRVEIAEHCSAHQTHFLQALVNDQAASIVLEHQGVGRGGPSAGNRSPAYEHIKIAIAVDVRQSQRPRAAFL